MRICTWLLACLVACLRACSSRQRPRSSYSSPGLAVLIQAPPACCSLSIAGAGMTAQACRDLASQLLAWQEHLKAAALAAAAVKPGQDPSSPLPLMIARMVRDACMINFLFGHTSLAQRGALLCSIKASFHADKPCEVPNCPLMSPFQPLPGTSLANECYGNRFVWTATAGAGAEAEGDTTLQIVAPHHKGSGLGVLLVGDAAERDLIAIYELRARPVISKCDEEVQQMFLDDAGVPFTTATLNVWWRNVLE